jgi:hypothetical protein
MPVVIGEPLARELYGAPQGAIGQTFEVTKRRIPSVVVGVAADTRHYGLEYEHGLSLYLPIEQFWAATPLGHVAVRINPAMAATAPAALRQAVWSAEPGLPVPVVRSMEDWITGSTAQRRFESAIFATFGAVALLLAAGGLYGTLLFVAGERRKELGIRLAMGATRGRIEGQLLWSGFVLGAAGVALGLVGAWFSSRFLESQIWGVERGDPFTLVLASGLLLVTALLASWVPARRAGRTDPLETLRVE